MKNKKMWGMALATFALMAMNTSCKTEAPPPAPFEVIPNEYQQDWQDLEYYMFIHFGPNTFTDVEWGDGKEDPKVFNPSDLDARQWASVAKDAGMKAIIITAKHHDGFCLWPSKYSTHTVRESLWKDGKGDVLKELSEACKEFGLKFGVYLSPWDQNHPAYATDEYNQIFANTLTEVLTGYGDVFEQWFDGANDGVKKQVYDWDMFHKVVYDNQPQAVIFSDVGPGCRWIGNESGFAGETNWSRMNIKGFTPGKGAPSTSILNQGEANGEAWVPGEVDVSIRPGWFYSPSTDDKVKTVEQLMDIYYKSVGRNANLLLNVPPDRRGRIHPADSARLMEFRRAREDAFKENLAKGISIKATSTRSESDKYGAVNLIDGKKDTYWTTDDVVTSASIELDFGKDTELNRLLLQEPIEFGQRIAKFDVEYWDGSQWVNLTNATTVGNKRILRFPTVKTSKIRVNITESLACPILTSIEAYKSPEQLSSPRITRDKNGMVSVRCQTNEPAIYYTIDGSEPNVSSTRYAGEFELAEGGVIKAIAAIDNGAKVSEVVAASFDVAPTNWKLITPSDAQASIDADQSSVSEIAKNAALEINLGKSYKLKGFTYTPARRLKNAHIQRYNFYVSEDGKNWTKVMSNAMFNNIKNNPIKQDVTFDKEINASYIKLEPTQLTESAATKYDVAELGVITR